MSDPNVKSQLRLAAIIVASTLLTGAFLAGGYVGYQKREVRLAEEKRELLEINVTSVMSLSNIGKYSDEEQRLVDGNMADAQKLRMTLVRIHQNRVTFWENRQREIDVKVSELKRKVQEMIYQGEFNETFRRVALGVANDLDKATIIAKVNLEGYSEAMGKLESWKPFKTIDEARKFELTSKATNTNKQQPNQGKM